MGNITMKDLEGKDVFLRPTGNNRRPSNQKEIIAAKIIKVARVYVTFIRGDLRIEDKGRINGLHIDTGHNSGYQVFPDRQAADDLILIESTAKKIVNKFQYARDYEKLDIETIKNVAQLLGVDTEY